MLSLERRYRLLLRTYPESYRSSHEEDIVATLLDASAPGQLDPTLREAAGLLLNGLRTRARLAAEGGWRVLAGDATRLAALVLLTSVAADTAGWTVTPGLLRMRLFPVLVLAAMVATVRGATRVAAVTVTAATAFAWMFLVPLWLLPGFPVGGYFGYDVTASVAAAAALLISAVLSGHRRPWSWSAAGAVALVLLPFVAWSPPQLMAQLSDVVGTHIPLSLLLPGAPVLVLLVLSLVANDPRPSAAAALYAIVNLGVLAASASAFGLVTPALLIVLTGTTVVTIASGTFSARRLSGTRL